MNEFETIHVIVNIDTSKKIGATTVYGLHELEEIIRQGVKEKGYLCHVTSDVEQVGTWKEKDRYRQVTYAFIYI